MGSPRSPRGARVAAAVAVVVLALGLCASVAGAHSSSKALKISKVWARTSPMEATRGAVYLTIRNSGDEGNALVGVKVPGAIASEAQIHETTIDGAGTMSMSEVAQIDLPAGKTTQLKPGGYHIMLIELAKPLKKGQTFEITLQFEEGRARTVTAAVKVTGAM